MEIINIIDKNLSKLKLKLDVISHNIANVNTPNYKRKDVSFKEILYDNIKLQIATTHPFHIKNPCISFALEKDIIIDHAIPPRADGNNVVLEKEIKELNETQILYQSLIKMLNYCLRSRKIVIGGR